MKAEKVPLPGNLGEKLMESRRAIDTRYRNP